MLDFCDAPYRFFPSKPIGIVRYLTRAANRRFILPGKNHRITDLQIRGDLDGLRRVKEAEGRVLLAPNHPTHSDPQVMTEVSRQVGLSQCFMAAYDVFLRSRVTAAGMQWNGAFSVDREGSDRKSMTTAIDLLKAGRFGLTIFPEGNVYLTNDQTTPFLEGASFIALKAQRDLLGGRDERAVFAIPVSLKYTYLTDVRPEVRERLNSIAECAETTVDPDADPVEELVRVGHALLEKNMRQRGLLESVEGVAEHETKLTFAAEKLVAGLEEKMALPSPRDGAALIDRIRKIRSQIHSIRIDSGKEADHRVASGWADEAILAFRILNYATPYTRRHPSLDRYAETVEKLFEDLHSRWIPPFGPRRAIVEIGEPIDLRDYMESFSKKARAATLELNSKIESSVQSGVDRINQANRAAGAEMFVS